MSWVVALIDGEHYPPVVRHALSALSREHDVVAAVFLGGMEKIDPQAGAETYGVPLVTGTDAASALAAALERYDPDAVIDLSDEPVLSSADRFRLASIALAAGVEYRGADFAFTPPRSRFAPCTPSLAIVGTGKRVGKTAVSAHAARILSAAGRDVVVLAMGRGGPADPQVIHGESVALTTADLLALAREGVHAASDSYEDAVMSRVTTVGSRRCGGGMAGETFFGNVADGARLADSLKREIMLLEGSGAAIPPVLADAEVLVTSAARGTGIITDYFGPFRAMRADLAIIAGAEEPLATRAQVDAVRAALIAENPRLEVVPVRFRPEPLARVADRRVFLATTAAPALLPALVAHLEDRHGCEVVAVSPHLSDRARLREDLAAASGRFDLLLTELKAAAVDVVVAAGEELGVEAVLCDNVPEATDGTDLDAALVALGVTAIERGRARKTCG